MNQFHQLDTVNLFHLSATCKPPDGMLTPVLDQARQAFVEAI
jgi:hypothetical protein